MAKDRIYVVGDDERLVRAISTIQARNHVARATIGVRLATQDDLIRLARNKEVEKAIDEPPEPPQLPTPGQP